MSSATSIDRAGAEVPKSGTAVSRARASDTFKPSHFFILASLLAATAAVLTARQARPEHLVLMSLTIGAAGFAAAALYRTLAALVSPSAAAAAEPLTSGMRAVLEREKMLALRAIKELEFDRAMGKLSAKDFDEMAGRLRARAMSLMKQLDASEDSAYRQLIERELAARMRGRSAARPRPAATPGAEPVAPDARVQAGPVCACGTTNDPDASFCKKCGTRLHLETGA
jgi:hypothetical protein